jgi:hypothetical protein
VHDSLGKNPPLKSAPWRSIALATNARVAKRSDFSHSNEHRGRITHQAEIEPRCQVDVSRVNRAHAVIPTSGVRLQVPLGASYSRQNNTNCREFDNSAEMQSHGRDSLRAGIGETRSYTLDDHLAFELSKRADHVIKEAAHRCRRVNALGVADEIDAAR